MKTCSRCLLTKDLSCFGVLSTSVDGHRNVCKDCRKTETNARRTGKKEYDKKYYNENKETMLAKMKQQYIKSQEQRTLKARKYYYENKYDIAIKSKAYASANKGKILEYQKRYKQENKDKRKIYNFEKKEMLNNARKIYYKKRYKQDDNFVIMTFLRSGFRRSISKKSGWRKFFELSGHSKDDYINHFTNNYKIEFKLYRTSREYHIDHIIPVSAYDFTVLEDIKNCWNPRNLRIITAKENMKKKDKLDIALIKQYGILDLMPKGLKY